MAALTLAQETKRKYGRLVHKRDLYKEAYKLLAKYILMRDIWFGDTSTPGSMPTIQVKGVSDDTVVDAARTAATAFGGALWPNTSESFELTPHPLMGLTADVDTLMQSTEFKAYYAECTRRARQPYDSPQANFLVSWGEHLDDQFVFGTSGIVGEEKIYDDENPVCFRSCSVETCLIDEGPNHVIDTVCFERSLTVRQLVGEYGIENVSEETRKSFNEDQEDNYIKVIHLIRPRGPIAIGADPTEKKNKKFASIHMEVQSEHILKEDGMDELPAFIVRFRKRPTEIYGRSLAMDALPSVRELNVLRSSMSLGIQKQLKPPIGFRVDMLGGAGTVDLSPDAKNAIYDTGMVPQGRPLVEQLMQPPDPRVASERTGSLEQQMLVKFLIDRLLDFNNKTRMTLGEAQLRTDFRNQALGNLFARQMSELLYPLIKWSLGVQWRRKILGYHPQRDMIEIALMQRSGLRPLVMPQAVANFYDATGKLPFDINFISPAARAMRAEGLLGLEGLTNYVLALVNAGQVNAVDNLDTDECIALYQQLRGAPAKALYARDKRDQARKKRQDMQAQMAQMQAQEQHSVTAKNMAKAGKDLAQAGINPQAALSA